MKRAISRSFVLASLVGILFVFGETMIRIFLSPSATAGDLPIYSYNQAMSFGTLMGYSSVWMFLMAAFFAVILGALNTKSGKNPWIKMPYRIQVFAGFAFLIALEYSLGYVVNITLGLAVWDYSAFFLNLHGQIALAPALMWFLLTPAIYFIDDVLRYYIWEERHPDRFISYYTDIL